jgi:hypothetical protein
LEGLAHGEAGPHNFRITIYQETTP